VQHAAHGYSSFRIQCVPRIPPTPAPPPFSSRATTPVQRAPSCLSSGMDQNIRLPECARIIRRDHQKVGRCHMPPPFACSQLPVTCARAFALIDSSLQRHGLFTRRECREVSRAAISGHLHAACPAHPAAPRELSALALSPLTCVASNAFWRLLVVIVILIHVGKVTGFLTAPHPLTPSLHPQVHQRISVSSPVTPSSQPPSFASCTS
jgi:hypothetical protein